MNANRKRCKIAHVIAISQYQGITIDGTLSLYKRTPFDNGIREKRYKDDCIPMEYTLTVAPRVGALIETHQARRHHRHVVVAPRVGAWIETVV